MNAIAPMTPLLFPRPRADQGPVQPSILDLPHVRLVSQGRAAIALALLEGGIGIGASVLIPAYHCPAMSSAVRAVGAECRFFRIREDLSIDVADVRRAASSNTKAVLIPHLFTVQQSPALLEDLRSNSSWLLIEDCAHSFFGLGDTNSFGQVSDFVIGSIPKFFPSQWGGVIASRRRKVTMRLRRATHGHQLKLIANAMEAAAGFHRLGFASRSVRRSLELVSEVRRSRRGRTPPGISPTAADESPAFGDVDDLTLRESAGWWTSLVVGRPLTFASRASARIAIFECMSQCLANLRHGRIHSAAANGPDFPPYVVPLLLDRPDKDFLRLKDLGVPMYRWEHSVRGVCGVADHFADALVQLPCHDTLTRSEVVRVCNAVRSVLG